METSQELKETLNETRAKLSGYERRRFMAQIVEHMFGGNQTQAEKILGWNRKTLRKALSELRGEFCYIDHYHLRGRKPIEEHLPQLLEDICAIVDGQSQTDPTFRTTRLFTRLSAAEVRRQLIEQKGYSDDELPSEATISAKLNQLGYRLQNVQKSRPQKNG
jgi:Rhodopirellula transposase DDE domain/Bacterial regulatory protein, Fis family